MRGGNHMDNNLQEKLGNQSSKTTADSVTFQSGGGPREHRNPQSTAA